MGNMYSAYIGSPDTTPDRQSPPTFDPAFGFSNGRKEREMKVSLEEMQAVGLRADQRDFCAHHLIDFYTCRRQRFPWVAACSPELHEWNHCQFDDWILRMKEYERERRLMERAKRKGILNQEEELGE